MQLDFRRFCGLHSRPNIYPCSLIEFLICHLMEPDRRNITAYKTYITRLLNSRTLLTWPNSWHLTAQPQMVRHIKSSLTTIASRTLCFEQGAKRLNMVMAERLVEYGPIWLNRGTTSTKDYDKHEGCIHKAVTTLMMLVVATKGQGIPETTKTELLKWLDTWIAYDSWSYMAPNDNVRGACIVLGNTLKYSGDRLRSIVKQRRRALKCIEFCALPTCNVETNLKTCARYAFAYI